MGYSKKVFIVVIAFFGVLGLYACKDSSTSGIDESLEFIRSVEPIQGAQNVTIDLKDGHDHGAYFEVDLSGIESNPYISNGTKQAWCIEWDVPANRGNQEGVKLHSTKGQELWREVNYFLSQNGQLQEEFPGLGWKESQIIIWSLVKHKEFEIDEIPNYQGFDNDFYKDGEYLFDVELAKEIISRVNASSQKLAEGSFAILLENDGQTIIIDGEDLKKETLEIAETILPSFLLTSLSQQIDNYYIKNEGAIVDTLNNAIVQLVDTVNKYHSTEELKKEISKFQNELQKAKTRDEHLKYFRLGYGKGIELKVDIAADIVAGNIIAGLEAQGGGGVEVLYDLVNLDRQYYTYGICGVNGQLGFGVGIGVPPSYGLELALLNRWLFNIESNQYDIPNKFEGPARGYSVGLGGEVEALLGLDVGVSIGYANEVVGSENVISWLKCPRNIISPTYTNGLKEASFEVSGAGEISPAVSATIALQAGVAGINRYGVKGTYTDFSYSKYGRLIASYRLAGDLISGVPAAGIITGSSVFDITAAAAAIVFGTFEPAEYSHENPILSYNPKILELPKNFETKTLRIENFGTGILDWSISSDVDWISFPSNSGSGDSDVLINVQENPLPTERKGEIVITSNGGIGTIQVAQSGIVDDSYSKIDGMLKSSSGDLIEKMRLAIESEVKTYFTTTDGFGEFSIEVEPGMYRIEGDAISGTKYFNISRRQTEYTLEPGENKTVTLDIKDGYHLGLEDITINGESGTITAKPGESLTLSFDYTAWSRSENPGSIIYAAAGFEGDAKQAAPLGIPGAYPGASGSSSLLLTAPSTEGTYTVYVYEAAKVSESEALTDYENEYPDEFQFIPVATVEVTSETSEVPTDGLFAYYPLDGNANDASGNGNDGNINGAVLTSDRFNNPNSAYQFDGNSDDITTSSSSTLRVDTELTFTAWINVEDKGQRHSLAAQGTIFDTSGNWQLFITSDNRIMMSCNNQDVCISEQVFSTQNINYNTWTHIGVTFSSGITRFYINGEFVSQSDMEVNAFNRTSDGIRLGEREYTPDTDDFKGKLDEVRLYNRALSDEEIQAIYDQ